MRTNIFQVLKAVLASVLISLAFVLVFNFDSRGRAYIYPRRKGTCQGPYLRRYCGASYISFIRSYFSFSVYFVEAYNRDSSRRGCGRHYGNNSRKYQKECVKYAILLAFLRSLIYNQIKSEIKENKND